MSQQERYVTDLVPRYTYSDLKGALESRGETEDQGVRELVQGGKVSK